jgi:hypothetical protein
MGEIWYDNVYHIILVQTGQSVGLEYFVKNERHEKKRRLNSFGENVHLLPDGSVKREEDAIINAQRIWRERAYAPGTGIMYKKGLERFSTLVGSVERCS